MVTSSEYLRITVNRQQIAGKEYVTFDMLLVYSSADTYRGLGVFIRSCIAFDLVMIILPQHLICI